MEAASKLAARGSQNLEENERARNPLRTLPPGRASWRGGGADPHRGARGGLPYGGWQRPPAPEPATLSTNGPAR